VASEPVGDWTERTRAEPVGEVAAEAVPGLEQTRAEPVPDDGLGLDPLAPVVCRYCRATAMPGDKFCLRCGMRLSRFEPVRIAAQERGELVCPDCGAMGPGPRCRRCGARMTSPA
jgi:DNA-directed RNA polymerase subunit RPC12/RpoP